MTTSLLAEQLGALSETIPQISRQLVDLRKKHRKLEFLVAKEQKPLPPHRRPFPVPGKSGMVEFMQSLGTPPRADPMPRQGLHEDEPGLCPWRRSTCLGGGFEPSYVSAGAGTHSPGGAARWSWRLGQFIHLHEFYSEGTAKREKAVSSSQCLRMPSGG